MIAAAYTATGLVLAGCAAYWLAVSGSHLARCIRYRAERLRYARRMRGPLPARDQDIPYDKRAWRKFLETWDDTSTDPERSRT
jgi:hypothetical protein